MSKKERKNMYAEIGSTFPFVLLSGDSRRPHGSSASS